MPDKDIKMPYDKHDAQLVAKAFQNLMETEEQRLTKLGRPQLSDIISYNMTFEMREET